MKTIRSLIVLLLVVAPCSAQLFAPSEYQLADYRPWFGRLDPANNDIAPSLQLPPSTPIVDYGIREWTTWEPTGAPFYPAGGGDGTALQTEIVFLGQTGDSWGRFGFKISGESVVLSESGDDRQFGSNLTTVFRTPEYPSFFIEALDGRPYDEAFPTALCYHGELQPISSVHDDYPGERLYTMNPYHVFAIEIPPADSEDTPSLFVFGVNTFDQNNPPIPEPSAYGLAGAAALLTLISWCRFRAAHRNIAAT